MSDFCIVINGKICSVPLNVLSSVFKLIFCYLIIFILSLLLFSLLHLLISVVKCVLIASPGFVKVRKKNIIGTVSVKIRIYCLTQTIK